MLQSLMFQRPLALLLIIPMISLVVYRARQNGVKILHVTRVMIIIVALTAIAHPSALIPGQSTQQTLTIIQDNSESAQLIDHPENTPNPVELQRRTVTADSPERTTKSILNIIEEDSSYLISSDFQFDNQRLIDGLKEKNVTFYAVQSDIRDESSVSIQGPDKSYIQAENKFQIDVESTSDQKPVPQLTVEGEEVSMTETEDGYSFNYTFDSEGVKKIRAEISGDDEYAENNEFHHVVDVKDKPDVIYTGSRIEGQHNTLLDQEFVDQVPDDTENYDLVVTNSETQKDLSNQIMNGQGLLHTGPPKQRSYLPLRPAETDSDQSASFDMARVAIVIDISVSNTEDIRNNKAIALNAIDGLSDSSQVAIIAYNDEPYLLSDLTTLQNNREQLKNTVKSIQTRGPTDHAVGLKAGEDALNGRGNMILITDGGLKTDAPGVENVKKRTLRKAANSSVRINVVDSKPSVNPGFLGEIASLTEGIYSGSGTDGPLSFVFDSRETQSQNMVATVDRSHSITEDHRSSVFTQTAGANDKTGAQTLMRSETGAPYLSVWRYGIGKVASISDKDSSLTSLSSQDPQLLLNTIQWLSSGSEEDHVVFEGDRMPESMYISSNRNFTGSEQLSRDRFVKTVDYNSTGFKQEAGSVTAYNYPSEIQQIGYDEQAMRDAASSNGGEVLNDLKEDKMREIATESRTREARSLENHLLALLLLLLIVEIGYRKRKRMI